MPYAHYDALYKEIGHPDISEEQGRERIGWFMKEQRIVRNESGELSLNRPSWSNETFNDSKLPPFDFLMKPMQDTIVSPSGF